jgi:hypothetical protein
MTFHLPRTKPELAAVCRLAATLLLTAAAGCGPPSAAEFNNALVRTNYQLREAGLRFAEALERSRRSRDSAELRQALADWLAALEKARKEIDRLTPLKDDESRNFLAAQRQYLAALEQLIRDEYGRIPKILDDAHLDPAEKNTLLADIDSSARAREAVEQKKLADAQRAFARRHSLTLWPTAAN